MDVARRSAVRLASPVVLAFALSACAATGAAPAAGRAPATGTGTVSPSASASPRVAAVAVPQCAARWLGLAHLGPTATASAPVPPRPASAVLCLYVQHLTHAGLSAGRLFDRIVMRGGEADGLAVVLAGATPVVQEPIGCDFDPSPVTRTEVVRLSYPSGRQVTATIHAGNCDDQGNELVGDHDYGLPPPVAEALLSDANAQQGNTGPPTPDLIGMNLAAAGAAASRSGLTVGLAGPMADPRAPVGTVIAQALPPGFPARSGIFPQVKLIVAVRPAPQCTATELRVTYRGNGTERDRDYGALVFRDVGSAPCTLPVPARITGLGRSGLPVIGGPASRQEAPMVLTPQMPPIPDGQPAPYGTPQVPGGLAGAVTIEAPDGGASCRSSWIIPATWLVSLAGGIRFTVANSDPGDPAPLTASGAFVSCGERLELVTETYYGQPAGF